MNPLPLYLIGLTAVIGAICGSVLAGLCVGLGIVVFATVVDNALR